MTFSVVRMSKQKFGSSSKFNDVTAFLFWINEQFRESLPGRDPNEHMDQTTMGPIRNKLWKRLESKLNEIARKLIILVIKPAVMKAQKENDIMRAAKRFEKLNEAASKMIEDNQKEVERLKKELEESQEKIKETEAKLEESQAKIDETEAKLENAQTNESSDPPEKRDEL